MVALYSAKDNILMTHDFISLAIIALVAALAPIVANLIPRKPVPETVLLLVGGAVLGPSMVNVIWLDESVQLLSELGCAMLFLLAGYEINPKTITGREGKRGLATWAVTLGLAFIAVHAFTGVSARGMDGLAVTVALTTTAIGALMPILKERGLLETRIGSSILSYGTWGELGPVLAMALLLSTRAAWQTVAILIGFVAIAVLVARFGHQTTQSDGRVYRILFEGRETTSQTFVRVTMLLLIVLVALSSLFSLDIVLGAFAAGFILRYVIPEGDHRLESKLDAIGYGFLIPLFFVISGAGLDLGVFKDGMIVLIGVVYILTRSLGKYLGAHYSAKLMKCEPQICKYLGITLLPQAGVALGQLGAEGDLIRNITLFAILIYELVGPLLTKMALQAAGEIHPMDEAVRNRRQHKLEQANAEKK